MEAKAIYSKKNLEFLLTSLPAEASEWQETRAAFAEAVKHLEKVIEHCEKEAHESLSKTIPRELECPCPGCKADKMLEVLESLDREQLLLIIQGEQAVATEPHVACIVKPREEAAPAGGAGLSTD